MFGKNKNQDQKMSFKVLMNDGHAATLAASMPILLYDGRYLQHNGVRRTIEVAKLAPKLWTRIPALESLKTSYGCEPDQTVYAIVMPSWAFKKFQLFKPMKKKDIHRTVSYMAAKAIFADAFMDTDVTMISASMFLDSVNTNIGMEKSQKNYCNIMRVLQMFEDKDGYLSSTDIEMAAVFIAAICEDCNAADIRKSVAHAAKISGKDIVKTWKKDRKDTKKKKKNGDSLNVKPNLDAVMYPDEDDDMDEDEPPIEEKPTPDPPKAKEEMDKATDASNAAGKIVDVAKKVAKNPKDDPFAEDEEFTNYSIFDDADKEVPAAKSVARFTKVPKANSTDEAEDLDVEPVGLRDMSGDDVEEIDEEDEVPEQPLVEQATIIPEEDDQ